MGKKGNDVYEYMILVTDYMHQELVKLFIYSSKGEKCQENRERSTLSYIRESKLESNKI